MHTAYLHFCHFGSVYLMILALYHTLFFSFKAWRVITHRTPECAFRSSSASLVSHPRYFPYYLYTFWYFVCLFSILDAASWTDMKDSQTVDFHAPVSWPWIMSSHENLCWLLGDLPIEYIMIKPYGSNVLVFSGDVFGQPFSPGNTAFNEQFAFGDAYPDIPSMQNPSTVPRFGGMLIPKEN